MFVLRISEGARLTKSKKVTDIRSLKQRGITMIDWKRFDELKNEIGEDAIMEIAEIFLEEMAEVVDPIRQGALPKSIPHLLHFLKGAALNVGFADLANFCTKAEQDPSNLNADTLVSTFDASKSAFLLGLAKTA